MHTEWILALVGGMIIGISVSIMLLFNGRVTGVSGIVSGALIRQKGDWGWRISFLMGLVVAGFMLNLDPPESSSDSQSFLTFIIAGVLVGFGTRLGNGCTSGHGVCGLSRLSPRSIVATLTFISAGVLTVYLLRLFGVYP